MNRKKILRILFLGVFCLFLRPLYAADPSKNFTISQYQEDQALARRGNERRMTDHPIEVSAGKAFKAYGQPFPPSQPLIGTDPKIGSGQSELEQSFIDSSSHSRYSTKSQSSNLSLVEEKNQKNNVFYQLIELSNEYIKNVVINKNDAFNPNWNDKSFDVLNSLQEVIRRNATTFMNVFDVNILTILSNTSVNDLDIKIIQDFKQSSINAYIQQEPSNLCNLLRATLNASFTNDSFYDELRESKVNEEAINSVAGFYKEDAIFLIEKLKVESKNKKNRDFLNKAVEIFKQQKINNKTKSSTKKTILDICKKVKRLEDPRTDLSAEFGMSMIQQAVSESATNIDSFRKASELLVLRLQKLTGEDLSSKNKEEILSLLTNMINFIIKEENITSPLTHGRLRDLQLIKNNIFKIFEPILIVKASEFINTIKKVAQTTINRLEQEIFGKSSIESEQNLKQIEAEQEKEILTQLLEQRKKYKEIKDLNKKTPLDWLEKQKNLLELYIYLNAKKDLPGDLKVKLDRYTKELENVKKSIGKHHLINEINELAKQLKQPEKRNKELLSEYYRKLIELEQFGGSEKREESIDVIKGRLEQKNLFKWISPSSLKLQKNYILEFYTLLYDYEKTQNKESLNSAIRLLYENRWSGSFTPTEKQIESSLEKYTPRFRGPNIQEIKDDAIREYTNHFDKKTINQPISKLIILLLQNFSNNNLDTVKEDVMKMVDLIDEGNQGANTTRAAIKFLIAKIDKDNIEDIAKACYVLLSKIAGSSEIINNTNLNEFTKARDSIYAFSFQRKITPQDTINFNGFIKTLNKLYNESDLAAKGEADIEIVKDEPIQSAEVSIKKPITTEAADDITSIQLQQNEDPKSDRQLTLWQPSITEQLQAQKKEEQKIKVDLPKSELPIASFEVPKEPQEEVVKPELPIINQEGKSLLDQWIERSSTKKPSLLSFQEIERQKTIIENYIKKNEIEEIPNIKNALHAIEIERIIKTPLTQVKDLIIPMLTEKIGKDTTRMDTLSPEILQAYSKLLTTYRDQHGEKTEEFKEANGILRHLLFASLNNRVAILNQEQYKVEGAANTVIQKEKRFLSNLSNLLLEPQEGLYKENSKEFSFNTTRIIDGIIHLSNQIDQIKNIDDYSQYFMMIAKHPFLSKESDTPSLMRIHPHVFNTQPNASKDSFDRFKNACEKIASKFTGFPVPQDVQPIIPMTLSPSPRVTPTSVNFLQEPHVPGKPSEPQSLNGEGTSQASSQVNHPIISPAATDQPTTDSPGQPTSEPQSTGWFTPLGLMNTIIDIIKGFGNLLLSFFR